MAVLMERSAAMAGDPYWVLFLLPWLWLREGVGIDGKEEANVTMQCVSEMEGSLVLVGYSCRILL